MLSFSSIFCSGLNILIKIIQFYIVFLLAQEYTGGDYLLSLAITLVAATPVTFDTIKKKPEDLQKYTSVGS